MASLGDAVVVAAATAAAYAVPLVLLPGFLGPGEVRLLEGILTVVFGLDAAASVRRASASGRAVAWVRAGVDLLAAQ